MRSSDWSSDVCSSDLAGVGDLLIRSRRGDRVGRDADDNVRVKREDRLEVRDLLLGLKISVRCRDYLDAEALELRLDTIDDRRRPVVPAVMHDDGGREACRLPLGDLVLGELRGIADRKRAG